MAAKLIALYTQPDSPEAFDKAYFETHMPLVHKIPGLKSVSATKVKANVMGGAIPYYMIAELVFDSMEALQAGLASPEGKAAGANVMGFAAKNLTMLTAEEPVLTAV